MIKTIFAAVAASLLAAPSFAQTTETPKVKSLSGPAMFSALAADAPPSISLAWHSITSNIACRAQARNKLFELGARDMSDSSNNSQWGTLGNIKVIVWCRDDIAIIGAAGHSYNAAVEARDALYKAF